MSHDEALVDEVAEAIFDVVVDHPMWLGSDGEPLDYNPDREARICDFAGDAARAVLDALDVPGRERRAKAEGIREAVARVRWVYDLQCPVRATERYHKWARIAHRWWEKVLGGELERLSRRAAELDPEEGGHE